MAGFARFLERLNVAIGQGVAWLTLVMVLITALIVVARYVFDTGWIWLQESVTWMHAAVFMLGAAYTLAKDEHVRVDVLYRDLPPRRQALIDVTGYLLFLIPFAIFLAWSSWDYVLASWQVREGSREAGGLGFPVPTLVKAIIPGTAALLLLQSLAGLIRGIVTLRSGQAPRAEGDHRWPA
jgi:TRAP-type mannitol/chloroaromatic compound transport system permease small subunit